MKGLFNNNISTIFSTCLAICLIAGGCSRISPQPEPPGEFIPLSDFELGWHYGDVVNIITKTEQSVSAENAVTGLYVLLADNQGNIVHRKSYWVTSSGGEEEGYDDIITSYYEKQTEGGDASRGTIPRFFASINNAATLGNGPFTFYAVANYSSTIGTELKKVMTATDLENLSVSFVTKGNINRTRFLMVAKEPGIELNINDKGEIERVGVNLDLKRVDAKIKFNLSVEIPEARPGSVSFDDMTYRVHQVPNASYLFPHDKGSGNTQESWDAAAAIEAEGNSDNPGYSCMLDDNYQTFDDTNDNNNGGTFAFYLRENRPVPETMIPGLIPDGSYYSSLYAMREAWDGSENTVDEVSNRVPVHGRTFTYAPENATFVEISGTLSYTRTNGDEVFGSVTYIVHLGETGNDPNDVEAVNNYDVRRNVNYIYNMRITGINNFEVEVTEEKELRPGAEGDITVSTNKQVTMDAHYGRTLFQLDRTSIEAGASWSVRTPIGEVSYDKETGLINRPYDYKWVLFAVNKDFGIGSDVMVKFPGIQAYDGGIRFYQDYDTPKDEATLKDEIPYDRGNQISYNGGTYSFKEYLRQNPEEDDNYYSPHNDRKRWESLSDNACLLDINQLINYLTWSLYPENGNEGVFVTDSEGHEIVTVTAFCDEYTYIYDPRVEDYIHPGVSISEMAITPADKERRLNLWKDYVNAGNRVMNITPMATTEYSPDGNTSLTNSYITITQNSIKSIYNPDNTDTAWGLETTNETGKLTHVTSTGIHNNNQNELGNRTNTLSDGRTNFLNFWVGGNDNSNYNGTIRWTDAMTISKDIEEGKDLNENYRNALYACITRNRDLNGNNYIDANEIYWYLAARDQLTGLWIGQGSLDEDAWMYNGDGTERNHLITSSHRSEGEYWILWAEEGSSIGGLRVGGDEKDYTDANGNALPYDYRCVRNLGIDIAAEEAPEHFAKISRRIENENQDYYTIDVSVINTRALRSSPDDGINLHFDNERSQNNTPYKKFDVRTENDRSGLNWDRMEAYIKDNTNPCPSGWRVPNQREFAIMMGFDELGLKGNLAIATSFSFRNTGLFDHSRRGFYFEYPNLRLADSNAFVYFRCVRDHTGD